MPIVYSAFVPHPPLIISGIGKTNTAKLAKTINAYEKISEELYSVRPDSIVIISPHGHIHDNSFELNLSPEFICEFSEFGDLITKFKIKGDVALSHRIKEKLETKINLQMTTETKLDYGSAVPLYMFAQKLQNIKIVPVYYANIEVEKHYDFGVMLGEILKQTSERVAVIGSGDLSHRLSKASPAGYSPKGKKFDQKLIEYLSQKNYEELMTIDLKMAKEAAACGLRAAATLTGVLSGMNYEPQLISYEHPFGVGYLVMKFNLL